MLEVYTRLLKLPEHSFFLFGPRGTGKTTWLRDKLPTAKWFDLLRHDEYLSLLRDPSRLRMIVETLPAKSWVVVDEVQKLPPLLDEVHGLISSHREKYHFALSGSSARKLKRLNANLLAGRAITRSFFPLTGAEFDFSIKPETLLAFGSLPAVLSEPKFGIDILQAYVTTYLREEIQQEALVNNIGSFTRFLEVAALMNAQVVNVAGIARDATIARPTVQRYFDTLSDTLIGVWLRPWLRRLKVRESTHPKFYFFDTGVVRALTNRLHDPIMSEERGALLETYVLHELRANNAITNLGGELRYWRTPAGVEIDFIWTRGSKAIGFEAKASTRWRSEYSHALHELIANKSLQAGFGIYLGNEELKDNQVRILPLTTFQKKLSAGELLG